MGKIKSINIIEPFKAEIKEVDKPVPQKGEALLKVKYGGVCGSDLKVFLGTMNNVQYPRIAGHEFSAEIEEVGENDKGLKPGMIVTATPYFGCGKCYCCRKGYFNCCQVNKTMGVGRDGAFQQYITVPIEKICDGKGIDGRTLVLIEPFANSLNLIKRVRVGSDDRILIFGAGPIGVFAMLAARLKGAVVFMADTSGDRLEFAKKMGADGTINVVEESLKEKIAEITGDEGFSICLEAVGSPRVFMNCLEAVSYRGKVGVIGVTKEDFTFNQTVISMKEIELIGSRNSNRQDFLDLIDLISEGRLDISTMISKEYKFDDAVSMYNDLKDNWAKHMKVLIKFD